MQMIAWRKFFATSSSCARLGLYYLVALEVMEHRRALRAMERYNNSGYMYQFTMDLPNWVDWELLGNYHSSELAFVFDNQWPPIVHDFDDKEKTLAKSFTLYWTNMARFGDPNHNLGANQQTWPK